MVAPVRTRDEFAALSRSNVRGRSGPIWVVRATHRAHHEGGPPTAEEPHVAYAVSKKVGNAVVRNRIRRRLRALMAQLGPDDGLAPGLYLVGVRPDAVVLSHAELRHRLVEALRATRPEVRA